MYVDNQLVPLFSFIILNFSNISTTLKLKSKLKLKGENHSCREGVLGPPGRFYINCNSQGMKGSYLCPMLKSSLHFTTTGPKWNLMTHNWWPSLDQC